MSNGRSSSQNEDDPREWAELGKTLRDRFLQPFAKPTYVFYFILSMAIGAVGIWIALIESSLGISTTTPAVFQSMLTFFAAVGSISCVQVLIMEDEDKHLRVLFVLVLFLFLALAGFAAIAEQLVPKLLVPVVTGGIALAMVTWWIANWDDKKFSKTSAQAPLGGDADDDAAGDIEGFTI
ncbi:MAG: hypothetical protein AAGD43_07310 [Pseudomonadota bacterium]